MRGDLRDAALGGPIATVGGHGRRLAARLERALGVGMLCAGVLGTGGCASAPLQAANTAYDKGDIEAAEKLYLEAIKEKYLVEEEFETQISPNDLGDLLSFELIHEYLSSKQDATVV